MECLQELIGNLVFKLYLKYAPYHLYMNEEGTDQHWNEMATVSLVSLFASFTEWPAIHCHSPIIHAFTLCLPLPFPLPHN